MVIVLDASSRCSHRDRVGMSEDAAATEIRDDVADTAHNVMPVASPRPSDP